MMYRFFLAVLVVTGLLVAAASGAAARQMDDMSIVVLRTIDKVSARTHTFEIPVDKTVKFGASLFIKVRACRKSLPIDKPESAAFLQIWERKPQEEKPSWVFSGWMFASNPAISAMDHPVYDVWVIECKNDRAAVKPQEFSTEETPKGEAPLQQKPEQKKPSGDNAEEKPEQEQPASEESDEEAPVSDAVNE